MKLIPILLSLIVSAATLCPATAQSVRHNDLVGYGIVVGLNGTGDSVRNAPFTEDTLSHMLERLGVNVQGEDIRPNNVASVLVTATLPPFARAGSSIDISVASIGDAASLEGGTLILTPLKGADNKVYAVAQGSLLVSGLDVVAEGARESRQDQFQMARASSGKLNFSSMVARPSRSRFEHRISQLQSISRTQSTLLWVHQLLWFVTPAQ